MNLFFTSIYLFFLSNFSPFSPFSHNSNFVESFMLRHINFNIHSTNNILSKTTIREKGENINEQNDKNRTTTIPFMFVLRSNLSSFSANNSLPREVGRNITMPDINDIEKEDMFEKF